MASTGRLFLCARCRTQVLICSRCDRGQVYCAGGCAQAARRASVRAAGRRYQHSRRGRFNHAARSRRYRARRENVTHQGSPAPVADALLPANSTLRVSPPPLPAISPAWHCRFCGSRCPEFVRTGFLRRRRVPHPVDLQRGGTDRGHWP